jgi:hypothetical protein
MYENVELPSTFTRVGRPRIFKYDAPRVDLRWQRWHDGWRKTDRDLRWYGTCIICARNLWAFDDGENDPRGPLGDNALWSITEDDQPPSRTCAICANDEGAYNKALQFMRHYQVRDWQVIEWPPPVELPEELTAGDEREPDPEPTYRIMRMYFGDHESEVIATGLMLEEAREHCQDPETSSRTATSDEAVERTERLGPWFDGYEEE